MTRAATQAGVWLAVLACGCTVAPSGGRTPEAVWHEFALPPERAAACFARNAQNHSSALVAEVDTPDARGQVRMTVRVRNGVEYGIAEFRPAGSRTVGRITLNLVARGGTRSLIDALIQGC